MKHKVYSYIIYLLLYDLLFLLLTYFCQALYIHSKAWKGQIKVEWLKHITLIF